MGDCGCGGGGAATTVTPHTQARAGQRSSCPVEECGCDTCVRIRIVKYLPWLSAADIAVGAHIPGGAMVIPELPEREPDLTPPWMWLWWEDGGGTGFEAPATREEGRASTEKAKNQDTDETTGGVSGMGGNQEEEESEPGSMDYWENKLLHMGGDEGPEHEQTTSGKGENRYETPCLSLPMSADIWLLPLLKGVCQYDLGTSVRYPNGTWSLGTQLHFELPSDYEPTRTKKEMREYCIPEWEAARTVSWSTVGSMVQVGVREAAPGLFWSEGKGFVHHAMMYALSTLYSYAELVDEPRVFAGPCQLHSDALRVAIDTKTFSIVVDQGESGNWVATAGSSIGKWVAGVWNGISSGTPASWSWEEVIVNGTINISAGGSASFPGGAVTPTYTSSGPGRIGFTVLSVIRFSHYTSINAALADYHFWWAWKLYSYGMDHGDDNALLLAKLAAKAALSEICEIASQIVHEYSHISGGAYEDKEVGLCVNCCHYLSQWTFLQQVLAQLALPFPAIWNSQITGATAAVGSLGNGIGGRFDFAAGEGWSISTSFPAGDASCVYSVTANHGSFWTPAYEMTVGWSVPARSCWDSSYGPYSTDTVSFGGQGAGTNR